VTYCYETEDGEIVELQMTIAEKAERQAIDGTIRLDDGRWAKRSIQSERPGANQFSGAYPISSESMAVHPSQIKDMAEKAEAAGVPTNFTKDGCPVLRSKGHRRKFAETFGYFDRNGGYSDPQRR